MRKFFNFLNKQSGDGGLAAEVVILSFVFGVPIAIALVAFFFFEVVPNYAFFGKN